MRSLRVLMPVVFLLAALAAVGAAWVAARWIEARATEDVERALRAEGHTWATVSVDGLLLTLTGTAPNEAMRFRALAAAGNIVDPTRVIDAMSVTPAAEITAPRFSVEILRNASGISLIGLIPETTARDELVRDLESLSNVPRVTDLMETARYDAPATWEPALAYALDALARLPRAKISVEAERVAITAITDSAEEKRRIETELARSSPEGVRLALDISAPRRVIAPFTLRFIIDGNGPRFDACSAGSEAGRDRIISAAAAAGLNDKIACEIGLGQPSPDWAEAVELGLAALAEIGRGSITFADTHVTLIAQSETDPEVFETAVGTLENRLPEGFALDAVLPRAVEVSDPDETTAPAEFVAKLNEDGTVQLRGRLTDTRERDAVESYAAARFGLSNISPQTRLDETLPERWPIRVFAGIDALARLNSGTVTVGADTVTVAGVTGRQDARAEIARLLADALGPAQDFRINVRYEETLDPLAALPSPEECVDAINTILTERQITFAPGSADIANEARETVDRIAEVMEDCQEVPMEVGGHTDSQGRESMNLALSRARAEAVVTALQARRILVGNLTARGYGETEPIADNDTEEGREANRRIAFRLLTEDGEAPPEGEAEDATDETAGEDTDEQN